MNEPQWFCLVVSPGRVRQIEAELSALGYRAFQPRAKRWVNHARVKTAKETPVFGLGRYLFVEVNPYLQSFGPVMAVRGVQSVISVRNQPWPMPRADVEAVLHRYLAGEFDETTGSAPIGARVSIVAGEFDNWLATVTGVGKGDRVSLKILGKNIRLDRVKLRHVRPAEGFSLARGNPEPEAA